MKSALGISPGGRIFLEQDGRIIEGENDAKKNLARSLSISTGAGLLDLTGNDWRQEAAPTVAFWRDFANRFLTALCHTPGIQSDPQTPVHAPDVKAWISLAESAPPMMGIEYLNEQWLAARWLELDAAVRPRIQSHPQGVRGYLLENNPAWHLVGRVTFHLAENRKNTDYPFAFLATYTARLSEDSKPQYKPLARALQEYAGAKNRAALVNLLTPVQLAAEKSAVIRELFDTNAVYQPQMWSAGQAYRFLRDVPLFEECGIMTRTPDWWKDGRGVKRPRVAVTLSDRKTGGLNAAAMLDFSVNLTLEGESITKDEWKALMSATAGLVLLRGQWVEVDAEKLKELMARWEDAQSALAEGLSMAEGMRLLSGAGIRGEKAMPVEIEREWMDIKAEGRLRELLEQQGGGAEAFQTEGLVQGDLRPYQHAGVKWLRFMTSLGLGGCLADDMGLGKTIQVLALLVARRREGFPGPNLLIVPASLMANWRMEIARFAPDIRTEILHPSEHRFEDVRQVVEQGGNHLARLDLIITTYTMVARMEALHRQDWQLVILDEAQAIKNPGTRQTRSAKKLRAVARLALTGTPVENRPGDLWSVFDFLNPGLLGSAREFSRYIKDLPSGPGAFAPLRSLVRPYIMRRLKTDKTIITDLPDKTEVRTYCGLVREQAALYQRVVEDLGRKLNERDGIERRGLILAAIMRFKQICNHPAHGTGDHDYGPDRSGKFLRLRELCMEIADRQDKVLIFSQFQEIMNPIERFLSGIFGRSGAILHGGTPVKHRRELVEHFQREDGPPFFVLSLKAGGTGLNLTAASHVIHFDRWWNPAVENQATDRAFRIGQKRNVLVHKFVCRGTIEEKIDELIADKIGLARDLLDEDAGVRHLTEMSNEELMNFVALDIGAVTDE